MHLHMNEYSLPPPHLSLSLSVSQREREKQTERRRLGRERDGQRKRRQDSEKHRVCVWERERESEMDAEMYTHRRGQRYGEGEKERGGVYRVREREVRQTDRRNMYKAFMSTGQGRRLYSGNVSAVWIIDLWCTAAFTEESGNHYIDPKYSFGSQKFCYINTISSI